MVREEWLRRDVGGRLLGELTRAQQHVYIVAPFIKRQTLERIVGELEERVGLTVITRWRVVDFVVGASDLDVFDVVEERADSSLLVQRNLHAKIYLADLQIGVIGSANCSERGFGLLGGKENNWELMLLRDPVGQELLAEVFSLEASARPVGERLYHELMDRVNAASEEDMQVRRNVRDDELWAEQGIENEEGMIGEASLPKCASPAELLDGVRETWKKDGEHYADVVHDRALLGAHGDEMGEEELRTMAQEYLFRNEVIQEFVEYCSKPRWFGQMVEWMHDHVEECSTARRKEIKKLTSNTINWLEWAFPNRFRRERPGHSECFGSAAAAEWQEIV